MSKIIKFFSPKVEMNLFEKQKTTAFIILGVIGTLMVTIIVISSLLNPTKNFIVTLISSLAIGIFIPLNLFILKKSGIKTAGNIFSIGLVVIQLLSLNILKEDISALFKFFQGFYTILGILAVGILFASKRVIILNTVLIIISTSRVYLFAISQMPEDKEILKTAFINHTATLVILGLVSYFAILFAEKAINSANEDAKIKEKQNNQLKSVFDLVKTTSDKLKNFSGEISQKANILSENSSEQAANVEEISATIEEITSSIIENTDDTQKTAETVNKTTDFAKKSEAVISNSLSAVKNISKKIGIIQDITFQTNILSLNAAIEAAKAGTAGKGFSVVAQEIKNLANKSSLGAAEIINLVDSSITESKHANDYIKNITTDIEKINIHIGNLANSSIEQRNSIEQINNSVIQINTGSQRNATISEELASLVKTLMLHSQNLSEILKTSEQDA